MKQTLSNRHQPSLGSHEPLHLPSPPKSVAEAEEALRVIFNSTCDSLLLHTPDGEVFDANDRFLEMYGVLRHQVPGIGIEAISSPSMSMHTARELWARVLAEEPQLFEWKARRLDNGAEFDVEVYLRRIELGGHPAILANIRDVSRRKATEAEMREQMTMAHLRADATQLLQQPGHTRELLQNVTALLVERFDAAFARVWTLNPATQTLELQASSGLYTHLDGAHRQVPVGQLKIGRIAQHRQALVTNQVLGDPQIPEQEWARREGLVAFAGLPLISEGLLLGVIALFARHTLSPAAVETFSAIAGALAQALGRKNAETALEAARQALAQANSDLELKVHERTARLQETIDELEHFSYTITHDMRAPLRAMQGLGNLLVEECSICPAPARREYLRRISAAAARMDKLITDALQYSKCVRQHLQLQPVDADALLRELLQTYPEFEPLLQHAHILHRLPVLLGNEAALTQCFSNLLSNAVKFSKPGQPPQVKVWAEPRGEFVRLCFEDNGIGVPDKYQEKIWIMFQKLDKRTDGTGIGLALVRKAVERMGGRAGVESELGRGSRFWIELRQTSAGHIEPTQCSKV